MRKTINILWLEDDLQSTAHKSRTKIVGDILKKKGYEANIIPKGTFEEAKEALENTERIDFFISDFNLEQENTGLSYVEEIRNSKGYKQFVILYSNKSNSALKEDVSSYFNLPTTSNFVFANFTFFSVGNRLVKQNFEEAIDVILCRWDELNAIRGRFMCENAEIEHLLREKLSDDNPDHSYRKLFEDFFRERVRLNRTNLSPTNKRDYEKLKSDWSALIDKRNSLAHVEEGFTDQEGYYICSLKDPEIRIMESSLDKERCELLSLKNRIIEFLGKNYY